MPSLTQASAAKFMPRRDLDTYHKKTGYRLHAGTVMWLFHRISGIILGLFLIVHMMGISGLSSVLWEFARLRPVVAAIGLLFFIHTANGIRLIFMEFANSADKKKYMPCFIITAAAAGIAGIYFAVKLLSL